MRFTDSLHDPKYPSLRLYHYRLVALTHMTQTFLELQTFDDRTLTHSMVTHVFPYMEFARDEGRNQPVGSVALGTHDHLYALFGQ